MSRKPTPFEPPGQTGEWFIDVVAPAGAAPTLPGADGMPVPSVSSGDLFDPVEDTFAEWEPTALSAAYRSKRTWRWPFIITTLLLAGVVGTALWWAPRFIESRIDDRRVEFSTAARDLQATLPAVAEAIAPVTGPDSAQALTAINAITSLQDAATRLEAVTLLSHPAGLPFVEPDPATELEPVRDRAARLAPSAETLGRRLTEAVTYRTIADDAFVLPDLPVEADPATISALSVSLATALADTVAVASALPSDPAFGIHDAYLDATITRYEGWQAEYLDALRRGDGSSANALIAELEAILDGLDAALVESLDGLGAELRQQVTDLDVESVEVQVLATG